MNTNPFLASSPTISAPSFYADRQAAAQAVRMALPLIEAAMQDKERVGESGFLYLVIMDPASSPARDQFEEAILYEYAVGDPQHWDADYAAFARGKAYLSWRTGLDSHLVQTAYPQLLQKNDSTLWGTACLDGYVVASSGAHPWYDEAFAMTVAACLKAIVKGRAQTETRGLTL
ncbi:hypothetical protein CDO44_12210 [Pigmentiphaga sp. NML080357]|uniref:hypothetical protein n=1 Tax=Pigmentiphaga sp. NML080357 TaxID=2008675 RepID=UPI000B420FA4|nr:hypothetical protein [Pigmentiphaga sp. NML080357]OVZ59368.1 hypothetical protein CDO44_12210 [Pigmentiphaga sp. NML080357]